MKKLLTMAVIIFGAAMMLAGNATAQQTPASTPPPASSASQAPATKPPTGTAATHHAAAAKTATPLVLKTEKDKTNYALGLSVGKSLQNDGVDVELAILVRGIKDELAGGKVLLTDDEVKAVMAAFKMNMQKNQEAKMAQAGDTNKKEGDAFLAANKTKDGVVTLPSGLQYKILTAGTGAKPTAADSVVCNYKGTLINGKEFDASSRHGGPATFPVSGVIRGWTEALQLMPVGSKWQLFIPPDLAYGQRGAGGDIGPGATLVFEVELLSIKGK
ncbi:MAG TPA: FKBP-type peptidyl-prolyl cis-trans isomerase [Candidatus Acidoferrales bacterium]|nr:FKBP-type peptidyl-prolyl cis-trans isomerase [Candidatus Acidoferrales bacterium]